VKRASYMLPTKVLRATLCAALVCLGCSKQGEGERCDTNSDDLDCESGLVCRGADQLSIEGRGVALCCPPNGVPPSVDACRAGTPLPNDPDDPVPDPVPPVDAGGGMGDGGP
jgi:hypothetical protein